MAHIKFNGAKLDPKSIEALIAGTLVQGNATSKWWKRQSADFLDGFMDTIRTSMNNGESLQQAITRIAGGTVDGVFVPGIMKTTRAKAGALAATSINAVSNRAALESFQLNGDVIKWVTQMSTLDNKTSDICIAYSGQTWNVMTLMPVAGSTLPFNGGPPRHFNCRSRLRPVTKSFKELGIPLEEFPTSTRASIDGQIPADISFDQFLRGKSTAFQDDLLGPKRAALWRNKDITLTQLVDMRGNPMTLSQLEAKVGIAPPPPVKPVINQPAKLVKLEDEFIELDVPDEGLKNFVTARADKGEVVVLVDAKMLERSWQRSDTYIPPDLSRNTIGNRIGQFEDFLKVEPIIEVGNVSVDKFGGLAFGNGRHRTRVLLNKGMDKIPVSMTEDSFKHLSKNTPFTIRKAAGKGARERLIVLQEEAQRRRVEKLRADREKRKRKAAEAELKEATEVKEPPVTTEDEAVITDPAKVREEARRFLLKNDIPEEFLDQADEFIELISPPGANISFGLEQKVVMLNLVEDKIKELKRAQTKPFGKVGEGENVRVAHENAFTESPAHIKAAVARRDPIVLVTDYDIKKRGRNRAGPAFYRDSTQEIFIHGPSRRSPISFNSTWRHEYGHALDYNLADDYFRLRGVKVVNDRFGKSIISGSLNKQLLRDNKAAQKWSKNRSENIGVYNQKLDDHRLKAGDNFEGYYKPLLQKHGMSFSDIEEILKRNFALTGKELKDFMNFEFLPNLIASMETGNVGAMLQVMTGRAMHSGGTTFAGLSDYFSAVTKNKIRGNWGHSTSYYKGKSKHKEAFANSVDMLGSVDRDFYKALFRAWGTNNFLDEVDDILKWLEKQGG